MSFLFEDSSIMLAERWLHMFCVIECCSKYWVPNNITGTIIERSMMNKFMSCMSIESIEELHARLKQELIGQPLAYDLTLQSISSHISIKYPSKSLVLSLHGSTGTGKLHQCINSSTRFVCFFRKEFCCQTYR
jgi:hypothetical protein